MSLKEKELYEFGEFRLDVAEHFLARLSGGERVELSEKAFETLCVLVRNAGHLVRKDELMNQVWADSFVEENNLDKCIYAIRKALGEKPGAQKYIETVRKHGYRLIVEVRRIEEEGEKRRRGEEEKKISLSADSPSPFLPVSSSHKGAVVALADWRHETDRNQPDESIEQFPKLELVPANPVIKSKSKYRAFVVAGLILGAIALGYFFYAGKTASIADSKKSIAVLPLKPINTATRDEIYEIGIADSLIYRLGSMKGFIIRPLSATRKYADIAQDPIAAGKEQQVDYVLASNYQLAGGRIRITAQLFNVASGQIEETYKSEKEADNIFAMQDAISGEIGNILSARFATTSSSPKAVRGTNNEEAYRLFLQARYLVDKRNLEDVQKAIEILEQVVKIDANYAQAWAIKSYAHNTKTLRGRNVNAHEEYQKSIEAVSKALALDANLPDAQSALCEVKISYEFDFAGAERACRRAVELDPNSSLTHQIYSRFLMSRGRFDEAIVESQTAAELDPAALFKQQYSAFAFYYARRYAESILQLKGTDEIRPNSASNYLWLIDALEMQKNYAEAFEYLMKLQTLQKTDEQTIKVFKTAYQTSGWQGVLREQAKRFDEGNRPYFFGACLNAQIGDKDKAFEYLEKAYQQREWALAYLQVEPHLDPLRDDPRFDELVRRVGLK